MRENNKPFVSIIVPVYNVENEIEKCVNSLKVQKYSNIEIILVNDGSTDSSGLVIEQCKVNDSRIATIHTENKGVTNARKIGWEHSTGEYCLFVDGDDSITDDAIEYFISVFKDSEYDFVSGWYDEIFIDGHIVKNQTPLIGSYNVADYIQVIQKSGIPSIWIGMFKRKLFDDYTFDIERKFFRGEDALTLIGLINNMKRVYCSDKVFYHYYQRNNSITHTVPISLEYILELINMRYNRFKNEYKKIYYPAAVSEKLSVYYRLVVRDGINVCWGEEGYKLRRELLNIDISSIRNKFGIKEYVKLYALHCKVTLLLVCFLIRILERNKLK